MIYKVPIIFFDVETTGLDITEHQIIELAALKIYPDGKTERYYSLFKPTTKISDEAKEVHGLDEEKLKNELTFKEKSQEIFDFFKGCDLGGYNVLRFDIPMLIEEFYRSGLHYNPITRNVCDVFKILNEKEPRNLSVMYKYYTGKDLENAHSAEADINATYEIFLQQIEKYSLPNSIEDIHKEITIIRKDGFKQADFGGFFLHKDNNFYYGAGKHKGEIINKNNISYIDWIVNNNKYSHSLKLIATMIKKRIIK